MINKYQNIDHNVYDITLSDINIFLLFITVEFSICLKGSLKFNSVFPNKQTFKFPSAVSRKRLHEPQKFSVIEVINPMRPRNPIFQQNIC